ncbi:MAG: 3-hydroxyacyl-CoA dehydrogenase family protein [Gaiella sp.]
MDEVRTIGVVGLGAMGSGIAQVALEAGYAVVGREVTIELAEGARGRVGHFLRRKAAKGELAEEAVEDALGRFAITTELADVAGADLVIEAIVEVLEPKQALFAELGAIAPQAILATNTSALSVTAIASAAPQPERVVGMHFFNPVPLMPLLEVVKAELSGNAAVATAVAVGEALGKQVVTCRDTPGFVVNRVLVPLLNDCIRALDDTGATPEELDLALTAGTGWPMGPCALADLVGIDVHVHAAEALYARTREPRMAPPSRLVAMRDAGLLGRKSGRGFYEYV